MSKLVIGQNDFATLHPELLSEWDYIKNDSLGLFPYNFSSSSKQKVWWKCLNGHSWFAPITYRSYDHSSCPYCSNRDLLVGFNDLATKCPYLVKDWDFEMNGDLVPSNIIYSSQKKVFWKCSTCGHQWSTAVYNRSVNHTGCKKCKRLFCVSFPEQAIFYYFKKLLGKKEDVLNQYQFSDDEGSFEIDIFIPSIALAIEHDGEYWHKDKARLDDRKTKRLDILGIRLYRLKESSVNTIDGHDIYYDYHKNRFSNLVVAIHSLVKLLGYPPLDFDIDKEYYNVLQLCRQVKRENNFTIKYPHIASEWNYKKNYHLNPEYFTSGSNAKVWWKCKHGHEWQAVISTRCHQNTQCPVCCNHVVISGFNDLATTHPELAKEWDYSLNGDLLPTQITFGSDKLVWWLCPSGHHWQSPISRRTSKHNTCPVCAENTLVLSRLDNLSFSNLSPSEIENFSKLPKASVVACHVNLLHYLSLASENPVLASEWDYEKNGSLTPSDVSYHSRKKVWWICKSCGYNWSATIDNRAKGRGCPNCLNRIVESGKNDVATLYPVLLKKWDFFKNAPISLSTLHPGSAKTYWWKCDVCGYEFSASIRNLVRNPNHCAVCSGKVAKPGYNDFATLYPSIAADWDYEKNSKLPSSIRPGNGTDKFWWKGHFCGHEWLDDVSNRIKSKGRCPYCEGRRVLSGFNDLATKVPSLVRDWNYEKNQELLPTQFLFKSHKIVWWKCSVCGHEWKNSISNRTNGAGCPACAKNRLSIRLSKPKIGCSVEEKLPHLLHEWDYSKNDALHLYPSTLSFGSDKKVWWKCSTCGYEWLATPHVRYKGHGCTHCGHSRKQKPFQKSLFI